MAPIKRPRSGIESGEGSANQGGEEPRKRVRISEVLEPSDISDHNEPAGSDADADSDDSDAIELQNQTLRERFARLGENVAAENGIIERVDCYNFMCHEHFSVELGPLINFIVGKNGSGKSAILTALTLCLGAKASATNRGQSLKKFIKEGKDSATIIVQIKNKGDTGFQPNEYGDFISVERHFSTNGASRFVIKNAHGRKVSDKKRDLDAITDYYSLQIDNPMNVLSQDNARQFLSNSTPAEKYKFFVRGVQLEQLDQDYKLLEEQLDQLAPKILMQQDRVKDLEGKKQKADQRLALSNRQEGLRQRTRSLRRKFAWAQVEEQELVRDACADEVEKANQKILDLEGEVENADQVFQEAEAECEAAHRAVQDAKAVLDGHNDGRQGVKENYDDAIKERNELQAQQRSISGHLKAADARIADSNGKIDAENERLANLDGGNNAHKEAELEQREATAAEMKNRNNQNKRNRDRLLDDITKTEQELGSLDFPIQKKQEEVSQAKNRLRMLVADRGQQRSGFSDRMPMLLKAIQNEHSFSRPPVGPLGHHMKLLKPEWSSVLENTFGGTLTSFVVTSKRDMNVLSNVMQRVNCVCPIIIGNDSGHLDTSQHEPEARFDTALRVLEIDSDLVRRQLVINHGVEQMLLIADLEEASSTLFDGARPRNVKRCFCIDKRDKRRGIHLAYNRVGDPSQSPVSAYNGLPRMKTDAETQIRIQQEVVGNLERELQDLMQQRRLFESNVAKCNQDLTNHDRQQREFMLESQRADDLVEELKDEIGRNSVNDGRLNALKTSLEEANEEKRLNEASYEDCVNAKDALVEKLKASKRELAAKDAEMAPLVQNLRDLEEEEQQISAKRRKALGDKNVAIGKVDQSGREKRDAQKQLEEIETRVLGYVEKATLVSTRVSIDAGETPDSLDKKLQRLQRDLDQYDREIGANRAELQAIVTELDEKYHVAEGQIQEFEKTQKDMLKALRNRQERWKKFRQHITGRAKVQFSYLLSERSFRGKMLTDHKQKLLDLQVEPDITKDSAGRGARTLSGGEKSFSQICLLLALWEAMGSPVRCLDEFDVYMDSINRKLSIDMLMMAARRSVGRQFVLITPGSRADISVAPDVRVNELAEPERGQLTLQFGR